MKRLHLDELKIKPIPNRKQRDGLEIHIGEYPLLLKESRPIDLSADVPIVNEKPQKTIIVDKRDEVQIDRKAILDKMRNSNVFTVRREPKQSQMDHDRVQDLIETVQEPEQTAKRIQIDPRDLKTDPKDIVEPEKEKDTETEHVKEVKKEEEDEAEEKPVEKKPRTKKTETTEMEIPGKAEINGNPIEHLLPKKNIHSTQLPLSPFYLNNRKQFVQKLVPLFSKYQAEIKRSENASCDSQSKKSSEFKLLLHQQVVRDYLNLYSPYRGLLLYHGLGSGKTCTSIAIAEGMKSQKKIYVLTLASLKANFFEQLKECGDPIYKLNQYWEFISIDGRPDYIPILAKTLSISIETVRKQRGAWMVNVNKPANFSDLSDDDKVALNQQIDEMIRSKYVDINYNGLNSNIMAKLTNDFTENPFDNSVVVIDEAHNFVSRIVNKLKQKTAISYRLYEYIMSAENARIVLLSGTPIINYPNEIGIMFNLLRGHIKTWTFTITLTGEGARKKPNRDTITQWFHDEGFNTYDFVDFTGNQVIITRNPFGFINTEKTPKKKASSRKTNRGGTGSKRKTKRSHAANKTKEGGPVVTVQRGIADIHSPLEGSHNDETDEQRIARIQTELDIQNGGGAFNDYSGVELDETGNISDEVFVRTVSRILKTHGLQVTNHLLTLHKALPDNPKEFMSMFVELNTKDMKNKNVFQKRILGLTSYFPGASENLYPRFIPSEQDPIFHVERVPMSAYQFGLYEQVRSDEWVEEDRAAKASGKKTKQQEVEKLFEKDSSTYRIFSRMSCNFAFPDPPGRPRKQGKEGDEDIEEDEEMDINGGRGDEDIFMSDSKFTDPKDTEGGGKRMTEEEKAAKAQAKAEAKAAKEQEKAQAKADKAQAKAEAKVAKEEAKAQTRKVQKKTNVRKTAKVITPIEQEPIVPGTEASKQVEIGPAVKEVFTVDPVALESPEGNMEEGKITETYAKQILKALQELKKRSHEVLSRSGLSMYSPKFLKILDNIENKDSRGLHLIYSQFRSIEGIGIFKMVLEENGFAEFKIGKNAANDWVIDIDENDLQKPRFALYTGTETNEEKKIMLNIYNGKWNEVPGTIMSKIEELHPGVKNNMYGDIIKVLMITSSGAEGINLKNTRFVHIMEPYWHMVRLDQVIGRARRICSHQDLPEELRTVKVYLYLSVLLPDQLKGEMHISFHTHDLSKLSKSMSTMIDTQSKLGRYIRQLENKPAIVTTDQFLFENALMKDHVNMQILRAVKTTAIDCQLYSAADRGGEKLVCYDYGKVSSNAFASNPVLDQDFAQKDEEEVEEKVVRMLQITDPSSGKVYAMDPNTKELYDYEQYERSKTTHETLVPIGNLKV